MNPVITDRFQQLASACSESRSNNKDDLCEQTRAFLAPLLSAGHTNRKSDEILAALLQSLAPALTSSHAARICALSTLRGALQACQGEDGSNLSLGVVTLLGKFLLAHVGPIEHEDYGADADDEEVIRDTALAALAVLLRTKVASDTAECLVHKMGLAKTAVENRVALSQDEHDPYTADDREGRQIHGLSLLPRSRRSLCFDLLQACADGMSQFDHLAFPSSSSLEKDLVQLVLFSCNCLHGESDPRCLLQLLRLLRSLCVVLIPYFTRPQSFSSVQFPIAEVFDAIAPYYPVLFNPPANNPLGVTKASLQEALRSVMGCLDYDAQAMANGGDTMLALSLGIILEQLLPLPGDEPTTMIEKLEALEDLSCLLFGTGGDAKNTLRLDAAAVRSTATALLAVHNEASLTVTTGNDNVRKLAKRTADQCRALVAKMALECEGDGAAWGAFVDEQVKSLSETALSSSSSQLAIAYMANLCGCGGLKTMSLCQQMGFEPLVRVLELDGHKFGVEVMSKSLYGMGAFFIAFRTTIKTAVDNGVVVIPHPLAKYGFALARGFIRIIGDVRSNGEDSMSLATAAVRAFESLLIASPPDSYSVEELDEACQCLRDITLPLLSTGSQLDEELDPAYNVFLSACTKTVGALLGRIGEENCLLRAGCPIGCCLQDELLPRIVTSAKTPSSAGTRYDWIVLADAARGSEAAASHILQQFSKALQDCLFNNEIEDATICVEALSFVLRLGGDPVVKKFQEVQPLSTLADTLVKAFETSVHHSGGSVVLLSTGVSSLELPPTEHAKKMFETKLNVCFQLGFLLRGAYMGITLDDLDKVISLASHALPPLSENDVVRLAVTLPCLSAALSSLPRSPGTYDTQSMSRLLPDLTEFTLRPEYHAGARAHAAICVHLLVANPLSQTEGCPAAALANDFIMPALQGAVPKGSRTEDHLAISVLQDSLTMLAVLAASAAARGGQSSRTADKFVAFIIDLACCGEATFTLGGERKLLLNLHLFDNPPANTVFNLSLEVASRFGSIFSNKGTAQLWKQRLVHISASHIRTKWMVTDEDTPSIGTVASICFMVGASNATSLDGVTLELAAQVVAKALSPNALSEAFCGPHFLSLKRLVLATLLKLLSIAPSIFARSTSYMVTGVVRAYASGTSATHSADVACKLLALQSLQSLLEMESGAEVLLGTKAAVLSVLTAGMNHPSSLLRNAAVDLTNALCLH